MFARQSLQPKLLYVGAMLVYRLFVFDLFRKMFSMLRMCAF